MQDYEVVKPIEDHAVLGTVNEGATVSADSAEPSIVELIETGFLKVVDAIKDEVEGEKDADAAATADSAQEDNVEAAETTQAEASTEAAATVAETAQASVVVPPPAHASTTATAAAFPTPPAPFEGEKPMLYAFCKAIELNEGAYAPGEDARYPNGTRAFFDKNPGNLRYAGQEGTIGEDKDGFAIFPDMNTGFTALLTQVKMGIKGGTVYKSQVWDAVDKAWREQNIQDFFNVYAPKKDGNDPVAYAAFVSKQLSEVTPVTPETPMYALIA